MSLNWWIRLLKSLEDFIYVSDQCIRPFVQITDPNSVDTFDRAMNVMDAMNRDKC